MNSIKKTYKTLSKKQKQKLILLIFLLLLGMLFEIVGLGILFPIIIVILDKNKISTYVQKFDFLSPLEVLPYDKLLAYSLMLILIIYLIKNIFLAFISFQINNFQSSMTSDFSVKLFSNYLNSDYDFHIENNSTDLIKNLQIDINYFSAYFSSLLFGFTEIFLAIAIILSLFFIEPFGVLFVFLLIGIMSFVFLKLSNYKILKWAKIREAFDSEINKTYIESLESIREIILSTNSKFFLENIRRLNALKSSITTKQATLKQLPRFYLETVSIFGIVFLIFFLIASGKSAQDIIAVIGVFTAATFRLLPSANKILQSFQTIKYYQNTVNQLLIRISENQKIKHKFKIDFNSKIQIENLSFKYSGSNSMVLDNLNFEIQKNEIVGIVGSSGSGKSTFVDLLSGMLTPTSGKIIIDDQECKLSNEEWKNRIGYVSQSIQVFDSTIMENIALGLKKTEIDVNKISEVIKDSNLSEFIQSFPEKHEYKIKERGKNLSGGQKQRLGIARALYKNPSILIFDESTGALDKKTEEEILKTIEKFIGQKTIIVISHDLNALKFCSKIYELKENKLKLKM